MNPVPYRLALSFALLLGACDRPDERVSVLLLTLDTTVPEALGCYGGPAGLTPALDRLAAEGLLFEDARAVVPLTLPSHASLMTGLYPPRHSVRRNGETRLSEEARTLAERAREEGYRTAAIVAAVVLVPEFGLAQGFEHYDAPQTPGSIEEHLSASRAASDIATRGLEWLEGVDDEPFFLWLHFFDPHFPYKPAPEFSARSDDPYLAEVAAMDAAIGRVRAWLESSGRLEQTLIVVVADHGESRGRHEESTHGAFVFDSTLRIPLIVRLPGAARAGERLEAPVSQVDVAPLVAARLGWPRADGIDGRDPLGAEASRGVYFESYFGTKSFGWSPLVGWTDGESKFIHSSTPELFDLGRDPDETRNLLGERSEEARRLRARIEELCLLPRLPRVQLEDGADDLTREIERLGYAGAGMGAEDEDPEPLAPSTRPSPHRMTAAYAAYMQGRKLFEEKKPREQAITLLEQAVALNPGNHKAWFTLGLARLDLQLFEAAASAFRSVISMPSGERIPAQLNLAVCLYNLGRSQEALGELESALSDTDGPPDALELLIRLFDEQGRAADAERARARLARRPRR